MKIKTIALNTFREAVRNKIFYLLIFFALFFIFSAKIIALLTVGDTDKIVVDIGLAAINFFSVLISIFTGINLVYKEIDKKTIFNILSKPVKRSEFLLGKFFGLALTTMLSLFLMASIFIGFLLVTSIEISWIFIIYFVYLFMELLIIISISILFSSFSTPILSFVFTTSIYLVGHVVWTLNQLKDRIIGGFAKTVFYLTYYAFPNLEKFNLKSSIMLGETPPVHQIFYTILYGIFFTIAIMSVSIFIFSKRDFK